MYLAALALVEVIFGASDDFLEVESGLAIFLNYFCFCCFNDLGQIVGKSTPLGVFPVSKPDKGAKANTIAFEGVPDLFARVAVFPF